MTTFIDGRAEADHAFEQGRSDALAGRACSHEFYVDTLIVSAYFAGFDTGRSQRAILDAILDMAAEVQS